MFQGSGIYGELTGCSQSQEFHCSDWLFEPDRLLMVLGSRLSERRPLNSSLWSPSPFRSCEHLLGGCWVCLRSAQQSWLTFAAPDTS